ncbi:outer mitochondrial membrane protein porin [Ceratocystis lukuohia]|uniref:Outer mitochondrial membrane protein porin n=1 Tax=Ceratocystis lukuohia TaxID=2019550 RepID=A0ABR4MLK1_9PEZI
MAVPAFTDIAKPANDLLNRDFYHAAASTFEFKSNTPNNVAFKVTGKSSHEKATSGATARFSNPSLPTTQLEGKYTDKPSGQAMMPFFFGSRPTLVFLVRILLRKPSAANVLSSSPTVGLTLTQTWNTANALDTKLELSDTLAKGLKAEGLFTFLPASQKKGAKLNLYFKQSNFHGRAFFNLLSGPTAAIDAVVGHEGFLAGASAGYDVGKATISSYNAAVGYSAPAYSAAITATDNLSVFSASFYQKVNSQVEAGCKASWNSKTGSAVGLEIASKYRIDPVSFAKAKINDRGIAALSYNVLLRDGVTLGLGASVDTQKLDQATHKIGTSFTFSS